MSWSNDQLGEIGEDFVKTLITKMDQIWHLPGRRHYALDGIIEIRKRHRNTGRFIPVQIKSGQSYKRGETKSNFIIQVDEEHLDYWKDIKLPVLFIWYNDKQKKAYWTTVGEHSSQGLRSRLYISKTQKFGTHCRGDLYRIANEAYGQERMLSSLVVPYDIPIKVSSIKHAAFDFYDTWRREGCVSPTFGKVEITRRAWNHLTSRSKRQSEIIRKLNLLPAAKAILENMKQCHLCRTERVELSNVSHFARERPYRPTAKRQFYQQTAIVSLPHRTDAVVSVITEQWWNGPVRFYSVFEHEIRARRREVRGGSLEAPAVWPLPNFYKKPAPQIKNRQTSLPTKS